ncbi:MAG: hypothetical protein AB7E55_36030 [Pigmentiphaga sp.]
MASVESGSGVIVDNGTSQWDIYDAASLVVRLTPSALFYIDELVTLGNCQTLSIDVRSPVDALLFSGIPEQCSVGSTPINASVGYVLISGFGDGLTYLNYGYFNYVGTLTAAEQLFWTSLHGQREE